MRKILNLSILTISVLALTATISFAQQQIAYVDSEAILADMPERKAMDVELESYQKQLSAQVEEEQKKLQLYYQEVMAKVQRGELSPKQQQEEEAEVQKMQTEVQKTALKADQDLAKKEQDLSAPILAKFNAALESVAKDNNFAYIVDKKLFLYLGGGIDATEKVRAAMQ
jgi:outer membrane protein